MPPEGTLVTLQRQFVATQRGLAAAPDAIQPSHRVTIHQRNMHTSLTDSLRQIFLVVQQLVGEAFFRQMAMQFVQSHPPQAGVLHHYGSLLPDFIIGFEPAASLPYLPDVAHLEWARHQAYWCEDAPHLLLEQLRTIPAEHYAALQLPLHPSVTLQQTSYNASTIWQAHQSEHMADSIECRQKPEYLLHYRTPSLSVETLTLSEAEWRWLDSLGRSTSLEQAIETHLEQCDSADIQAMLLRHVTGGAFAANISI